MSHNSFDIIGAATNAVRFVTAERRYMFAAALFPFVAALAANFMTYFMLKGQDSVFFAVLLMLGEAAVGGWFMFLQARLILFGERLEQPPADAAALRLRHNDMRAAVLTWMLFKLWLTAVVMYLVWVINNQKAEGFGIFTMIGLFLTGAWIWSLRLSVAHILVGVGYSIKKYLFRVNGLMGSLRLVGLGMVVSFPFQLVSMPLEEKLLLTENLATPDAAVLLFFITLISTALMVFLNAAAVFAMKDMLSRADKRRGISKV
ncbi:MAG TPA: hypothetical protein VHP34_10135 [Alphaproteobacteria bacterium]|nr:hypothetical protein [Alphaproteobacteria bacterium]